MELRILRYFLAVAREESITRASESLHVTQPTLSRQLAQLEDELGVQLLIRGKRKVTLTEEGMLLRRRVEEVMELLDKAEKELKEQDDIIDGKILIGSGDLAASKVIPEIFQKFKELYPRVTLDIYTGNADQIKEKLDKGLLDIGLLLEPVAIDKYDFIRLNIKERWAVMMRGDDPLAKQDHVRVEDIKDKPIIMVSRSSVKNEIASWFGDSYENLNIVASHNLTANAAHLVEQGIGYAVVLEGSAYFYDSSLITTRPLYPELEATSVLAWKKHQLFSPTVLKFLSAVKSYVRVE